MGCPMLLPAPPRPPCSQFDALRWAPGPQPDPGLDLLSNTPAQPSTATPGLPRQVVDRPRPVNSIFSGAGGSGRGVGAGTGALWGPRDSGSLGAASAKPGSYLGSDGLPPGGRFWVVSTQKAWDSTQRWARCASGSRVGART